MTGIRMNDEVRTARQNFDAVMANPAWARFDFGERLAIVNVDFQNGQTRIDRYATAYADRCAIEARADAGARAGFAMNCGWAARFPDMARRIDAGGRSHRPFDRDERHHRHPAVQSR